MVSPYLLIILHLICEIFIFPIYITEHEPPLKQITMIADSCAITVRDVKMVYNDTSYRPAGLVKHKVGVGGHESESDLSVSVRARIGIVSGHSDHQMTRCSRFGHVHVIHALNVQKNNKIYGQHTPFFMGLE